jgi:hypothetical protein
MKYQRGQLDSEQFYRDVEQLGRWHIYGQRDELDPQGRTGSIDAESAQLTDYDDESFGLGYKFILQLRKGRRQVTSGEGEFTAMGPVDAHGAVFDFRPEPDWYPGPLDLIFECLWPVPDPEVPYHSAPEVVLNVFRVRSVVPLFGVRDDLVFWKLQCDELLFNRARLTAALSRRFPEGAQNRRYRRR